MSVVVATTDIVASIRPRSSKMFALPVEYLSGFLYGW